MQRLSRVFALALVVLASGTIASTAEAGKPSKVSLSGRVELSHTDSFSARKATFDRFIVVGKRKYRLTGRKAATLGPGAKVKVAGRKTGVDVDVDGVTTLEQRSAPPIAASSSRRLRAAVTTKRVAIVLFRYQNDPPLPTNSDVSQRLFSFPPAKTVTTFFKEISGGQLEITAGILGPFTINQNRPAGCNWEGQFVPQAKAAMPAGLSLISYDLPVYVSPAVPGCGNMAGASRWGSPQSFSYINGLPADQEGATRVLAHELGHQLYLHHASAYLCDPRGQIQPEGSSCRSEYGDPFDAMSNSMNGTTATPVRQFSSFHKAQLASRGTLAQAPILNVTKSGTYQLSPSNVPAPSQPTTLAIPRPNGSWETGYYYLETRAKTGIFDDFNCTATPSPCDSVQIRLGPHYSGGPLTQSLLIDTNPQTAGNFNDAPLGPNRTFADDPHGFVVTNLGVNSSGITRVKIDITDKVAPTVPTRVHAKPTKGYMKLTWGRSYDFAGNAASGASGPIAGYDIYRDGQKIGSATTTTMADVPSPGTHSYTVCARDPSGNVSPMSDAITAKMAGNTAALPDVSISDPANGSHVGGPIEIVGSATGHGSSIRTMTMYVDGRKAGSHSGGSITRTWDPRPSSVAAGEHQIVISAIDAEGNTGSDEVKLYK